MLAPAPVMEPLLLCEGRRKTEVADAISEGATRFTLRGESIHDMISISPDLTGFNQLTWLVIASQLISTV